LWEPVSPVSTAAGREARTHHQIDVATHGVTPLYELRGQNAVVLHTQLPPYRQTPTSRRGRIPYLQGTSVANDNGSPRSALAALLVALGAIGGLALVGWLTVVLLDLKHLNTSGFTLP
jgi:hypothetical protein